MARSCVFCGSEGKLTKEHAIPQWMETEFGNGGVYNVWPDITAEAPTRQSKTIATVEVRQVCGTCNSGWMNDLEKAVRPLLVMLKRWETVLLDATRQGVLSAWAWKTILMLELAGGQRLIPADEYERFYQDRSPPPSAHIWIMPWLPAGGDGRKWAMLHWRGELRFARTGDELTGAVGGYRQTIAIPGVAFQGIGEFIGVDNMVLGGAATQRGFIDQIWPFERGLAWPSPYFAGQRELERFVARDIGAEVIPAWPMRG
jgi:hypothetical protein